jgi:peptidoglycan biosynthesis protein MviN/MurJ (putative lipid II flippase)
MTENEKQEMYPVRTMHEFLYQVEHETNRFKRGAVISILISAFMLVLIAVVSYELIPRGFAVSGVILIGVLTGLLIYSIYLMSFQYRFFRRWEKRLNQLNTLEAKLMPEEQ